MLYGTDSFCRLHQPSWLWKGTSFDVIPYTQCRLACLCSTDEVFAADKQRKKFLTSHLTLGEHVLRAHPLLRRLCRLCIRDLLLVTVFTACNVFHIILICVPCRICSIRSFKCRILCRCLRYSYVGARYYVCRSKSVPLACRLQCKQWKKNTKSSVPFFILHSCALWCAIPVAKLHAGVFRSSWIVSNHRDAPRSSYSPCDSVRHRCSSTM